MDRDKLLMQLQQMKHRLRGAMTFPPPNKCHDTQAHLAGVWLRAHVDELIEVVRDAAHS